MNTLLVSYDLVAPGKDYEPLWDFLKSHNSWATPLLSVYLVKSQQTASDFLDSVRRHVDSNDKVIVIDVTGDTAAWVNLDPKVSEWIKSNI